MVAKMAKKQHDWQMGGFKLTVWAVVVISFGGLVSKAVVGRPSSISVQNLLGSAVVASILAIIVPRLEPLVFSKLRKLNIKGLEIELIAKTEEWINKVEVPLSELESGSSRAIRSGSPFPPPKLTGLQCYQYERLTHGLYIMFNEGKDMTQLDQEALENYRKLIKYVAIAASASGHYSKALEVLKNLESFRNQEFKAEEKLSADEMALLARTYIEAAYELAGRADKVRYWRTAENYLEAARKKKDWEVRTVFNLGLVQFELGKYKRGIQLMKESIEIDAASIKPWALWGIACGQKKLENETEALGTLKEIPQGPWWDEIEKDPWLQDLSETSFMKAFKSLCEEKTHKRKASPDKR